MTGALHLLDISDALDRAALRDRFAIDGRVQVRDVLTSRSAAALLDLLARGTPWGLAWQAADDGPNFVPHASLRNMPADERSRIGQAISDAMRRGDYAFSYHAYPMLRALQERWNPGGPHDILLEHLNAPPFLELVRAVTGMDDLVKADAQATLYAPGQFLARHDDSHVAEGWRIAYVLNMTQGEWREDFGGYLLFLDEGGDVSGGFRPRFNSLNLFAVPARHCVTFVAPYAPLARFAITGWVRDR